MRGFELRVESTDVLGLSVFSISSWDSSSFPSITNSFVEFNHVDVSDAVPTAAQHELHAEAAAVLAKAPELIRQVDAYAGCAALIQKV
jgi:hypothetical protein